MAEKTEREQDYVERLGAHHFPTDGDLIKELDTIENRDQHYGFHVRHWCEDFERRRDDRLRWRRILEDWLAKFPTIKRLQIVSEAIQEYGTRSDMDMLTNQSIDGDYEEIAQIIEDARFGVMMRSLK